MCCDPNKGRLSESGDYAERLTHLPKGVSLRGATMGAGGGTVNSPVVVNRTKRCLR